MSNNSPHALALVVDLGAQNVQLIARRVREAGIYSEIATHKLTAEQAQKRGAKAVIFSNVPSSVIEEGRVAIDPAFVTSGIPVFTLGRSKELFERAAGGTSAGVEGSEELDDSLKNFLLNGAGIEPDWNAGSIADEQVAKIRSQVGGGKVLCALSGGVDSAVAAALVHKAVGDQLTCVFVDHGLLREGEREQVEIDYVASTGVRLITVDAREQFLTALAGVTDPEAKRKIIGHEFIRVFEQTQENLMKEASAEGEPISYLVQGTIYPDIVESGVGEGNANIKSHHNVGGLPEDMKFELVEPLTELFKDEVRAVGRELGLPEAIVGRQPFPGPGLGIRIVGEVSEENLRVLRKTDAIVRRELTAAGLDDQIWQCPVVLLAGVRSVGVSNEERTYGHPIVLRPVWTEDAMQADWVRIPYEVLAHISAEITSNVPEVNRVVLDITPKPPGTIEWE